MTEIKEYAQGLRAQGRTLRQIADDLSRRGFPTSSGRPWTTSKVQNLLQDKDERNARVREHRASRAEYRSPSVYAVWFPAAGVIKIGYTAHETSGPFVAVARHRALVRGWPTDNCLCIWRKPGDLRAESWIQATLAFQWRPAYPQAAPRMCEWFDVAGMPGPRIVRTLDDVYQHVPVDQLA